MLFILRVPLDPAEAGPQQMALLNHKAKELGDIILEELTNKLRS